MVTLPAHLQKYVVSQDYVRYTPISQAVWRHVMRQLKAFLSVHGHESYLSGLEKTGLSTEEIPNIDHVSRCLEKFGWRAVPVSGFLPPAAFMELQALGVLPVCADLRTIEHLTYTPAPDILHEAAGHAPILAHQEFADYLRAYSVVAQKSILSKDDMNLYEAIRVLSDLKEDPDADPKDVTAAEKNLTDVTASITKVSEATLVSRMNWWTVEYGLIGSLDDPKIYGAGLLSSLEESRCCLTQKVKKIPFSIQCIEYAYDITDLQPQLFVTPDFKTLLVVLEELAERMAYRRGGVMGLARAKEAETVNTVQYNSGLQVSGVLKDYIEQEGQPVYLQFSGPTQLSVGDHQLDGHGAARHKEGFGSPVGNYKSHIADGVTTLTFDSGVVVTGKIKSTTSRDGRGLLMTFADCTVTLGDQILFDPAWGEYDMVLGSSIPSVFGGPADRGNYGETDEFVVKRVSTHVPTAEEKSLMALYARVRELRHHPLNAADQNAALAAVTQALDKDHPTDWLLKTEIEELTHPQ